MANSAAQAVETAHGIDFGTLTDYAPQELFREAELFLYREARLLDTERLSEWLKELVDPSIRYRVISRELRYRKDKRYNAPAEVFIYDDDYTFLKTRVDQFHNGMQWRVDPPERYRRLVTNIEVFETGKKDEYAVRSNCLAVRSRRAYEIDQFIYCREDVVRRCPIGTLRLVQRRIDFDERSVAGRNMVMLL